MNMPTISSRMLTASRKTQGDWMLSMTALAIVPGIC